MSALFDHEHCQRVARHLAENDLIELTPDQVDKERRKAFATIRRQLVARGWKGAARISDEELLELMKEAGVGRKHKGKKA